MFRIFFNVRVLFFIILNLLTMHSSNAYNLTAVKNGDWNYSLRGFVTSTDMQRLVYPKAVIGLTYLYNDENLRTTPYFNDESRRCPDDKYKAVQTINSFSNSVTLRHSMYESRKDNSVTIYCQIDDISPRTYWVFQENIGRPVDPSAAQCNVNVPSEVNFSTVTVGDNNKVIEKQLSIKCNKAAKMKLTLLGDSHKNILVMSGTTIKLGVGGDTQSKVYDMKANETTTDNLNFTMSDTGSIPGAKRGYVLLVSDYQ